jgi:TRAP-type uncharacterized transport system substrate-binding protein
VAGPLDRPLAARHARHSMRLFALRLGVAVAIVTAVVIVVSRIDVKHDMHRMHVRVLSGVPEGNYHAIVARLGDSAAREHGSIENVPSAGSAENVRILAGAARTCDVHFALAQDGTPWSAGLELVGRLAKPEVVLFAGKNGDSIHAFADLRGLRIGVGAPGSGAEAVGRALFALPDLAALGATLSNHGMEEQLAMAARGDLDLALVVIDPDAPLVEEWVGKRGLQIASLSNAEAVARRLPHLKTTRIVAGAYDAVRPLPASDKTVMSVETVILGNRCAGRVATIDLLGAVAAEFPDFIRHNKQTSNTTGLAESSVSAEYFANEGPELADEYVPWLVDVMPPANWAYVVMAVSLLFNAMGAGHRFRLWRIDAARVKLEGELSHLFPPSTTLGDIQRTQPDPSYAEGPKLANLDHVVAALEDLAARSRRYSLSVLVPMGQEMAYRYQEGVIYETLAVLRDFRKRCVRP